MDRVTTRRSRASARPDEEGVLTATTRCSRILPIQGSKGYNI